MGPGLPAYRVQAGRRTGWEHGRKYHHILKKLTAQLSPTSFKLQLFQIILRSRMSLTVQRCCLFCCCCCCCCCFWDAVFKMTINTQDSNCSFVQGEASDSGAEGHLLRQQHFNKHPRFLFNKLFENTVLSKSGWTKEAVNLFNDFGQQFAMKCD